MIALIDVTSRKGETIMITQQHENEIQNKAQAPAPVKQHRWIVVLLSILGVAVPLIAGWEMQWPWVALDYATTNWFLVIVGVVGVPVAVGAFLLCFVLRAWWAAVFAGIAWFVGGFLASVVRPLVEGGWAALPASQQGFWMSMGAWFVIWFVPLLIGMLIGGAVGFAYGKERALRQ